MKGYETVQAYFRLCSRELDVGDGGLHKRWSILTNILNKRCTYRPIRKNYKNRKTNAQENVKTGFIQCELPSYSRVILARGIIIGGGGVEKESNFLFPQFT